MTARIIVLFGLSLVAVGALADRGLAQTPSAPAPTVAVPAPPNRPVIPEDKIPAKTLFSGAQLPSLGKAMAIGYYPRGCLQGGVELPVDGPNWQVMRLSRNRNWGHPELIKFLERFAPRAAQATGWKGVLIGDMAQPRGGPLPFDHLSHQIGLDVDIWFMPMPNHELSKKEREDLSAINVVSADWLSINPKVWTPQHFDFIKTAAEQPDVERVLVNARSRRKCAASKASSISPGCRRCGPGTAITTTSMCGWPARPIRRIAASSRRCRAMTVAATKNWPSGSPTRC